MKLLNLTLFCFLIVGCTNGQKYNDASEYGESDSKKAVATMIPLGNSNVSGSVTFEETEEGVLVSGRFEGLESGAHGFHVHQYGDCSSADGSSAGGHYNPNDSQHASPEAEQRHMGDMGNLEVNGGTATVEYTDNVMEIGKIIGRAVIIHAGEDDLQTQPSGDSGNRIACGVIGIAQSQPDVEQENQNQTQEADTTQQ